VLQHSAREPWYRVEEAGPEVAAAGYEAVAADREYLGTWLYHRDGDPDSPQARSLYAYRDAADEAYEALAAHSPRPRD